jgi:outer membrane protein, heavy metal efflux system
MNRFASFWVCVMAGLLPGCQTSSPQTGFDDVRQLTAQRTGLVVQWKGNPDDEQLVAIKVAEMLSGDLNVNQAAQIALLNNHHLQATFEDLGIAQADLVQAGLLKNPVFDMGVRFPDRSPAKTYLDIAVAEDFLDVALIPARKKLAADQLKEATARVSNEVLTLVAQTRSDFYAYQATQQMAEASRVSVQAADAAMDAAKQLHSAGNLAELDYSNERAEEIRAEIDLADALSATDQARQRLADRMGLVDDQWKVSSHLPDIPADEFLTDGLDSLAIKQRQDLAAARSEIAVQARTLELTEGSRFFDESSLGPEFERETDGQWRIGPTFSLPIPLFDQGHAKMARARAILRQSQQRYEAMKVDIQSEVRIARDQLLRSRAKALIYRDQLLPVEQDILRQTQLHYNAMSLGVFQLLEAKRRETDAVGQYVAALRDYWTARAELEQAVGGSIPGRLGNQVQGENQW